ncbi:uncharacterized protein LOC119981978 [Tripterygium wilfordii]|uniref:uncharacterized protein LOC119981978 n=1 Tax=Tripterygium wilfordii TaxID=458696 RepID=UPI0018F8221E|nr:uncharacterized protein LOC119981978 [Tripterygium wilfordii]
MRTIFVVQSFYQASYAVANTRFDFFALDSQSQGFCSNPPKPRPRLAYWKVQFVESSFVYRSCQRRNQPITIKVINIMSHQQPSTKRVKTLFSFFKKKYGLNDDQQTEVAQTSIPNVQTSETVVVESSIPNVHISDTFSFERDPGLRIPISDYPVNQRDEIRRRYLKAGPFQYV